MEPVFWVSYRATSPRRECTRIDGSSGRVFRSPWFRYPVAISQETYALEILLDPKDADACDMRPEAVWLSVRNLRSGLRTNGYVGVLLLGERAGERVLPPRFVDCQDFPAWGNFGCSLPRERVRPDLHCTVPRQLYCASGCEAVIHLRLVDPPQEGTLHAVPRGCPHD